MKSIPDDGLKAIPLLERISTYKMGIRSLSGKWSYLGSVVFDTRNNLWCGFRKAFKKLKDATEWAELMRKYYNVNPVLSKAKNEIYVLVLKDEATKLICCNDDLKQQVIERIKASGSRGASTWLREETWKEFCKDVECPPKGALGPSTTSPKTQCFMNKR